jgi:hypothetical protein
MKRFIFPLNEGIHLKLKVYAAEQKTTMQMYVAQAILEKLLRDEVKKDKKDDNG